jgi:hypothetical protein
MHRKTDPLILLHIISIFTSGALQHAYGVGCILAERAALLSFKKGILSDIANLLASWRDQDCCRWRGIRCSNQTGHVISLHLRTLNPDMYADPCDDGNSLFGEINPSSHSLEHLNHMDLSMNSCQGQIALFLSSWDRWRT